MNETKSIISNRPRDCLSCRLVSGFGLTGIGAYVSKQAFSMKRGYGQLFMHSFALGAIGFGVARLLNLPPFNKPFSQGESS